MGHSPFKLYLVLVETNDFSHFSRKEHLKIEIAKFDCKMLQNTENMRLLRILEILLCICIRAEKPCCKSITITVDFIPE